MVLQSKDCGHRGHICLIFLLAIQGEMFEGKIFYVQGEKSISVRNKGEVRAIFHGVGLPAISSNLRK